MKKWSTEFGIQEDVESLIATVRRWRSLKSVDCTKIHTLMMMCSLVYFVFVFFADHALKKKSNKGSSRLECYWFMFWFFFFSKTGFARMHDVFTKIQENCWNWENESWWTTVIIEATTEHLLKPYVFWCYFPL